MLLVVKSYKAKSATMVQTILYVWLIFVFLYKDILNPFQMYVWSVDSIKKEGITEPTPTNISEEKLKLPSFSSHKAWQHRSEKPCLYLPCKCRANS